MKRIDIVYYVLTYFLLFALGGVYETYSYPIVKLISALMVFILLVYNLKVGRKKYSVDCRQPNGRTILLFFSSYGLIFLGQLIGYIIDSVLRVEFQEKHPIPNHFWIVFGICLVFPILEELIFRGWIPQLFKNKNIGLLVSSLLFVGLHLPDSFGSFIAYAFMSCAFSVIYLKTQKIGWPILLHVLNNSIAFVVSITTM